MLNNLKNAASSVATTAKNIAAEALETAQELRQIHEVSVPFSHPCANRSLSDRLLPCRILCQLFPHLHSFQTVQDDWSQKVQEEQKQKALDNSLQNESHSPVVETEVKAQPIPPPPPISQPPTTTNDVSARLAALKAKIQADKLKSKINASNSPKGTTTRGVDTAIARPQLLQQQPTAPQSSSCQSEEVTATIQQLKAELERERSSQARASEAMSRERVAAEQATSEVHRLRELLEKMMEENTLLHNQVAAAAEAADSEEDDEATQLLMVQLKNAREEAVAEKSKVAMLEKEMQSLQLVVEQTQAAEHAASLHGSSAEDTEAELVALRAECAVLTRELERLRVSTASASSINNKEGDSKAAAEVGAVAQLTQELEKSESDKAALKQQLIKLKTQLLGDQEDEEEKIQWRVDAEVKLALEKIQQSSSSAPSPFQSSSTGGGNNSHREEIATLTERCEALERDVAKYEHAAAAQEAELSNLQKALAELTYESEAAERLRAEARGLTAETRTLRNELDTAKLERLKLEERVAAAEGSADDAKKRAAELAVSEGKIQGQLLAAQAALAEAKQKESAAEQGALIDRRVLVKMLVSFFQRGQQVEVLELMAKMLGFTDNERDLVFSSFTNGNSSRRSGKHNINNNSSGGVLMEGGDSLAASWVDFLVRQLNEEEGRSIGTATTATSVMPVL
jgi:hypothetical protein